MKTFIDFDPIVAGYLPSLPDNDNGPALSSIRHAMAGPPQIVGLARRTAVAWAEGTGLQVEGAFTRAALATLTDRSPDSEGEKHGEA